MSCRFFLVVCKQKTVLDNKYTCKHTSKDTSVKYQPHIFNSAEISVNTVWEDLEELGDGAGVFVCKSRRG